MQKTPQWPLIGQFDPKQRPFSPMSRNPAQIFADALSAMNRGDRARALELCRLIRANEPQYFDACRIQAMIYNSAGEKQAACDMYARLIALCPDFPETYSNGCRRLADAGDYRTSMRVCARALVLRPDFGDGFNNLASLYIDHHHNHEAIGYVVAAICLKPELSDAWYNLGVLLQRLEDYHPALKTYRYAGLINVNDADALCNAGLLYLLLGELNLGFWLYEWRWFSSGRQGHAHTEPLWNGEALAGKTILLHGEQGMGDIVQFLRYLPWVKSLGGQIVLEIAGPLIPLVKGQVPADIIIAPGGTTPAVDLQCPLMSLPRVFGTNLGNIPASIPYLRADPARLESRKITKRPDTELVVGLCWSGNPAYLNDAMRSIPLEKLVPLLVTPAIDFHVLQKDLRAGDHVILDRFKNVHVHALADFSDTAALIAQMDVVISVDTVTAHLAGAMGCPTWVLLPSFPDWRWLLARDDSPWYPAIRLFRRRKDTDWSDLIPSLLGELLALQAAKKQTGEP
jgi:Tfp pilus assembly protein PilF